MMKSPRGWPRSLPSSMRYAVVLSRKIFNWVPAFAGRPFYSSGVHQGFDFLRLDRNAGAEILVAAFAHHDVILEAHAEAFLGDVDARLHGDHEAVGERLHRPAVVVHVEAERVAQPVRKIFPARGTVVGLLLDVLALDEAEREQLLVHHHLRFLLPVAVQLVYGGAW